MIFALLLLAAPTIPPPQPGYVIDKREPWAEFKPQQELGPGPHTLVIINAQQPVRIDFKSGRTCQKARDAFLRQFYAQHPNLVASGITVACIPR